MISALKSFPDWAEGAWTLTVRIVRHADSRGRDEVSGLVREAAKPRRPRASDMAARRSEPRFVGFHPLPVRYCKR